MGLAGTVAALAAIDQGLRTYDRDRVHHYRLTRTTVERSAGEPRRRAQRRPPAAPGSRARPGGRDRRAERWYWPN